MLPYLDSAPTPIPRDERASRWARFRVLDPYVREKLLREISRIDVPLVLMPDGGGVEGVPALLWSVDVANGTLRFSVTGKHPVEALAAAPSVWAAGYLREVKVQFEMEGFVLDPVRPGLQRPGLQRMMSGTVPSFMLRLPRRTSLRMRVRRVEKEAPTVRFMHPLQPEEQQMLPLVDISTGGCALWQHPGATPLVPGARVEWAQITLDAKTVLHAGLQVHYRAGSQRERGTQLGCEWHDMNRDDAEMLQHWIARARRGRDLISLDLS